MLEELNNSCLAKKDNCPTSVEDAAMLLSHCQGHQLGVRNVMDDNTGLETGFAQLSRMSKLRCCECNEPGHVRSNCPKLKKNSHLRMKKVVTLRVRAPQEDGLPRLCATLMLVMDWASNRRSVLEDIAVCVSKCPSDVANGTGVMSGVSWVPDGVSCGLFDPPEQSSMVTLFGKLLFCSAVICWSSSLCFDPTVTTGTASQSATLPQPCLSCRATLPGSHQSQVQRDKRFVSSSESKLNSFALC